MAGFLTSAVRVTSYSELSEMAQIENPEGEKKETV